MSSPDSQTVLISQLRCDIKTVLSIIHEAHDESLHYVYQAIKRLPGQKLWNPSQTLNLIQTALSKFEYTKTRIGGKLAIVPKHTFTTTSTHFHSYRLVA